MFYNKLKEVCEIKKIKLTPMLKELGISPGNTEQWKKDTLPNGKILIKLANKLNCSVDYLLEIENKEENNLTKEEKELLKKWNKLDVTEKDFINEKINTLIEIKERKRNKLSC